MGFTVPGLIFEGISACFKLHNVINGSEQEGQKNPSRTTGNYCCGFICWLSRFKSIYASDKEEFQIEKCNIRILSVPVTSNVSRGPRLDTDRRGWIALSRLSALLKTPCWIPLCSEPGHPELTQPTAAKTAKSSASCKPDRTIQSQWDKTSKSSWTADFELCSAPLHVDVLSTVMVLLMLTWLWPWQSCAALKICLFIILGHFSSFITFTNLIIR